MRLEPEAFEGKQLELIYVARKLKEALRLEDLLTERQTDYLVRTGTYGSGIVFPSVKVGAFFYVDSEHAESCRALLRDHGYRAEPSVPPPLDASPPGA